ncbi:MAG: GNAT family N-acetyltransferase [SAR324 cluster bacterium]|nr:GNAT family N-acetyltransferase [SAR324 cluster bacterium]
MEKAWNLKQMKAGSVVRKIPLGSRIYIGNLAGTPQAIVEAMVRPEYSLEDTEIMEFCPGGDRSVLDRSNNRFRANTFFMGSENDEGGKSDYTPIHISSIPRLVREKHLKVDVALIKVTPPDDHGLCSLGVGVDMTKEMVEQAKLVIAEVNANMPWTTGESAISTEQIDYWVENNAPMMTRDQPAAFQEAFEERQETLSQIGKYILHEIPNGATLQLGRGDAPNAVLPYLKNREHLGLHTEMFNDDLMALVQEGVIDNTQKNVNKDVSIVSHCFGSHELYDFVNNNPKIEFHSLAYTNNPSNIGANNRMIAIDGAFEVDVTGQVCSESLGRGFYGGFEGKADFIRGASYSQGGKPIIALFSTTIDSSQSNIVPMLRQGAGIVITRADIHYVISEYGVAYLYGKPIRERCLALIDIAHPKFRDSLLQVSKEQHYVRESQPGHSFKSKYPKEWESVYTSKDGRDVLVRPAKAIDEDYLRDFFHSLSDHSVYMRYFKHLRTLSQQILQSYSDIDYAQNMALIALYPPETASHDIIGMAQWVSDARDRVPEIAFQVSDDWQGQGIGKYLMFRLIEIAKAYGYIQLKAETLTSNHAMKQVFENAGFPFEKEIDFGVISYTFDISE